jgi:hypothetical protein
MQAMMKRRRGAPPGGATSGHGDGGKRPSPDDVQRLLAEWRRQIVKEKAAAKQHRVMTTDLHPVLLEEIKVVTRIGRLLPRSGRRK